ncbi:MAG TPA: hypothetical protein VMK05_08390 [Burkholderiales bacterium]|nr:hypothetical protein [Burkholderiales bacterium]
MSPQRYLGIVIGVPLVALVALGISHRRIDPLHIGAASAAAAPSADGGAAAPADASEDFWRKAFAVSALKPASVILGTSRAENGLDAAYPGFAADARPVYNLGLGGVSIEQIRLLLAHAQRARPLRQAVIGLDLEAFLEGGRGDFDPAVLGGDRSSEPEWLSRLRLDLSWSAIGADLRGFGLLRSRDERTPLRARAAEFEGQRGIVWATEFSNFYARLPQLFPAWNPGTRWDSDSRRAASMRAFRDLLAFARRERIDLRLFISPVHARYLELYHRVGWWPLFEAWKRALVDALAEDAAAAPGRRAFPLWDFSGYNAVTMERVPALGDLRSWMRWYNESSHYSREHGARLLDRVLGRAGAGREDGGAEPGVLLDATTLNPQLGSARLGAERYRAEFPADAEEVARIAGFLRRLGRK